MRQSAPKSFLLCPDDHYLKHVGRASDGRGFFLTTPFVPAESGVGGREFIALYLFGWWGKLVEARIDDLGPRAKMDEEYAKQIHEQRLREVSPAKRRRIRVRSFQVERFGVTFGLIARPPEDDEDHWWVTVEPGDYIAFTPPWDRRYDT